MAGMMFRGNCLNLRINVLLILIISPIGTLKIWQGKLMKISDEEGGIYQSDGF